MSGSSAEPESNRKKQLIIGGIVGGVLLIALIAFLVFGGGSGDKQEVVSESKGASPTTLESQTFEATSTTAPTTTTTTAPPTTTTTAPPEPDKLNANINGAESTTVTQGFPTASVTIAWETVVSDNPVFFGDDVDGEEEPDVPPTREVRISGPGVTQPVHPESGSMTVCPSAEPDTCNVVPGSYAYTLTLFVNGENTATASVTLNVEPRPAP